MSTGATCSIGSCGVILISNFGGATTASTLKRLFVDFGNVMECNVIVPGAEERDGYALLKLDSVQAADRAQAVSGCLVDGRVITVESLPVCTLPKTDNAPSTSLYVKGLATTMTSGTLKTLFSVFGPVDRAEVAYRINKRKKKYVPAGWGIVKFVQKMDACVAMTALQFKEINHQLLHIKFDESNGTALDTITIQAQSRGHSTSSDHTTLSAPDTCSTDAQSLYRMPGAMPSPIRFQPSSGLPVLRELRGGMSPLITSARPPLAQPELAPPLFPYQERPTPAHMASPLPLGHASIPYLVPGIGLVPPPPPPRQLTHSLRTSQPPRPTSGSPRRLSLDQAGMRLAPAAAHPSNVSVQSSEGSIAASDYYSQITADDLASSGGTPFSTPASSDAGGSRAHTPMPPSPLAAPMSLGLAHGQAKPLGGTTSTPHDGSGKRATASPLASPPGSMAGMLEATRVSGAGMGDAPMPQYLATSDSLSARTSPLHSPPPPLAAFAQPPAAVLSGAPPRSFTASVVGVVADSSSPLGAATGVHSVVEMDTNEMSSAEAAMDGQAMVKSPGARSGKRGTGWVWALVRLIFAVLAVLGIRKSWMRNTVLHLMDCIIAVVVVLESTIGVVGGVARTIRSEIAAI